MYTKVRLASQSLVVALLLLLMLSGCYSPWGALAQPTPTPEPAPDPNWSSEQLATALYSLYPNNRWLALKYLKERGPAAAPAVPALIEILHTSPSVDMRVEVASILGFIGPGAKDAVPALIDQLRTGRTRDDKLVSTGVLGDIGPEATQAVPALIHALTEDEDDLVRSTAASSLGKISSDKELVETFITQIQVEKSERVQIGIAEGLCAMGASARTTVPYLAKNLWWPSDFDAVKQKAAKAIATIAGVEFYDDDCAKGGYTEFVDGELRTVVEAREWWTNIGQYQDWSLPEISDDAATAQTPNSLPISTLPP